MLFGGNFLEMLVFGLPALIIAMAFHEFAHAFAADRLGDPTPRFQGRLTMDIRKHIDIFGMIMLLLTGFGWGKAVETDPRYLKNAKIGMALIAFAGPLMNILIALIAAVIGFKSGYFFVNDKVSILLQTIFIYNAGLAVFNLIPIPPLDGSKIITVFMSSKTYFKYMEFQYKYQMPLILALFFLASTRLFRIPLNFAINTILHVGNSISNLLPF